MFIDEVEITVRGGKGGDGRVSFFPRKKGPDGGNGGRGGNVYAVVNPQLSNLNKFAEKHLYEATDGKPGEKFHRQGADGKGLTLQFPPCTSLIDLRSNVTVNLTDSSVLLCRGGSGGRGNDAFKSPTHQTPHEFERGFPGEERQFKAIMRLIADFGLVGLPNSGKSSLLNELTAAQVKTAPYPFTTLEPNLGAIDGRIIADIPGLIEGASVGKGLGTKFLKHIEKVQLLLHCIAVNSADVTSDYQVVMRELEQFTAELARKPQIVLLTKADLVSKQEIEQKRKILRQLQKTVLPVSIHDWDTLQELRKFLLHYGASV